MIASASRFLDHWGAWASQRNSNRTEAGARARDRREREVPAPVRLVEEAEEILRRRRVEALDREQLGVQLLELTMLQRPPTTLQPSAITLGSGPPRPEARVLPRKRASSPGSGPLCPE